MPHKAAPRSARREWNRSPPPPGVVVAAATTASGKHVSFHESCQVNSRRAYEPPQSQPRLTPSYGGQPPSYSPRPRNNGPPDYRGTWYEGGGPPTPRPRSSSTSSWYEEVPQSPYYYEEDMEEPPHYRGSPPPPPPSQQHQQRAAPYMPNHEFQYGPSYIMNGSSRRVHPASPSRTPRVHYRPAPPPEEFRTPKKPRFFPPPPPADSVVQQQQQQQPVNHHPTTNIKPTSTTTTTTPLTRTKKKEPGALSLLAKVAMGEPKNKPKSPPSRHAMMPPGSGGGAPLVSPRTPLLLSPHESPSRPWVRGRPPSHGNDWHHSPRYQYYPRNDAYYSEWPNSPPPPPPPALLEQQQRPPEDGYYPRMPDEYPRPRWSIAPRGSGYPTPRYHPRWMEQPMERHYVSPSSSHESEEQQPPYMTGTTSTTAPHTPNTPTTAPYTYVQQPRLEEKTMLRKKFSWKHYPELERFLIGNRDEYLKHSALNYTAEQKQYNNWLTERLLEVAARHHYVFDPEEFSFVAIRDRIRCYYKSYVQTARKRGMPIQITASTKTLTTTSLTSQLQEETKSTS